MEIIYTIYDTWLCSQVKQKSRRCKHASVCTESKLAQLGLKGPRYKNLSLHFHLDTWVP